jgi:hypothetical protein
MMPIAGCDEIQGWTYGRPISAADVTSLLLACTLPDQDATSAAYDLDQPLFQLKSLSG